jgi:hypothetical protein
MLKENPKPDSQRTSKSNQTHARELINQKTDLKKGDSNYAPLSNIYQLISDKKA